MILDYAKQGSPEWFQSRCGVVTSSMFKTVMANGRTKGSPSLTRATYMRKLANENLTGDPITEGFRSKWMQDGTDREVESRLYYSFVTKNQVQQVGVCFLNEAKRIGASVDGLIDEDGQLELKNPKLDTHLLYLENNELPAIYKAQVHGQLWVTGRQWCDFCSYHPDAFRPLFTKRICRDEEYIQEIETAVYKFIGELDVMVENWRKAA